MDASPADEYAALCDQIRGLLDLPLASRAESLEGLEHTLTEGYARALALEAEQWRLERRIGELGADVGAGAEGSGVEITALAARLANASGRLTGLRALLAELRERVDAVRSRAAYAAVENAGG